MLLWHANRKCMRRLHTRTEKIGKYRWKLCIIDSCWSRVSHDIKILSKPPANQHAFVETKEENNELGIDQEIECLRHHNIITLYSHFLRHLKSI